MRKEKLLIVDPLDFIRKGRSLPLRTGVKPVVSVQCVCVQCGSVVGLATRRCFSVRLFFVISLIAEQIDVFGPLCRGQWPERVCRHAATREVVVGLFAGAYEVIHVDLARLVRLIWDELFTCARAPAAARHLSQVVVAKLLLFRLLRATRAAEHTETSTGPGGSQQRM